MGFFSWIKEALTNYGKSISDYQDEQINKQDRYKPRYTGQWVNKGSRENENWVWVDKVKRLRPVYVNVFQVGEDDYIIVMSNSSRRDAIDTTKCEDERQAERLMRNLGLYYQCIGNVTINSDI